ncbi:hypothetical protein [Saccharothrix stipae]
MRLCATASGELVVSAQGLDGGPPVTAAVAPIDGLPGGFDAHLVPAPGALVIGPPRGRDRPGPVVGFAA